MSQSDNTINDTMTDSQASKFMRDKFPPQNRQDSTRIVQRQNSSGVDLDVQYEARRTGFNADLIAKNNNLNGDMGVTDVLKALVPKEDKQKLNLIKKITREPLVAGLGFLNNISFPEASTQYRPLKVDEIRNMIITKYNMYKV